MRRIIVLTAALISITVLAHPARAEVTLEPVDVPGHIMTVTNTWIVDTEGETEGLFPEDGFLFVDGEYTIDEVYEERTGRDLEYEVEMVNGKPAVRAIFPHAIPAGSDFTIRVKITAFTDQISMDLSNSWVYEYVTTQDFEFIVPDDHYLVYCNLPATIHESDRQVHVNIPCEGEELRIRIETRRMM